MLLCHINVDRLHNGIVWMQSDPIPQRLHTVFLLEPILISVERQSMQLLPSPELPIQVGLDSILQTLD